MSQFRHVFVDKDEGLSSSGDDQGRGLPALPQTFVDNDETLTPDVMWILMDKIPAVGLAGEGWDS